MSIPPVSVIVPVGNTEARLLRACVESLLAQRFQDFELLLVDDGGTAALARRLDAFAERDGRVRVFHSSRRGPSAARNLGLERARGAYIAFVDADDWVLPDFLADAVESLRRYDADVVWGQAALYGSDGAARPVRAYRGETRAFPVTPEVIEEVWLRRGLARHMPSLTGSLRPELWAKLYRRGAIGPLRFRETLWNGEDQIFLFELLRRCARAACVPRDWYAHRLDNRSMQNGIAPRRMERFLRYFEQIDRCCAGAADEPKLYALRDAKIAASMMDFLTPYACNLPLRQSYRAVRRLLADARVAAYCAGLSAGRMRTVKECAKWVCLRFRLAAAITLLLRRKRRR